VGSTTTQLDAEASLTYDDTTFKVGASAGNGKDVIFYTAGTAAHVGVHWDADLATEGTLVGGADDHGVDLKFFGETSGNYMLWDMSTDDLILAGSSRLHMYDAGGGEYLLSDGTDLTIAAGADLNLTAGTDINIPANVGLTFGDDGEKIEGDGTNMSITANNILFTGSAIHHSAPLADNADYHTPAMVIAQSADTCLSLHRHNDTGNRQLLRFFDGDIGDATHRGYVEIDSNGAVNFTSLSDYRLKENETAISDGLTRVKALKPYRFNFKEYPGSTRDGFFAHEVDAVVPQAVSGDKDAMKNGKPDYQGLDMTNIIPILVAAIKEIDSRVTALE